MKRLIGCGLFCLFYLFSYGQEPLNTYRLEYFGSVATGAHTPFWTVNHHWGATALEANNFYMRAGLFHQQTIARDLLFDFGIDIAGGNHSNYGTLWVQQLYGRLQWKKLRLDMGSREDYLSLLNPRLSSGDIMNSNHARPHPQIRGSLADFLLVPYTKQNVYLKADFSIGGYLDGKWLENRAYPTLHNYAKNVLSHSKSLYFRFGNIETQHRQQFTFGFAHKAQWGGVLVQEDYQQPGTFIIYDQPQNPDAFIRMLIAKEGSPKASPSDQAFVSGSHWGAYLLKYDYKLKNNQYIHAYIQHPFEDGTGMILQNYPDNLYGLEWRSQQRAWVSGVVLEYIYTKQQTGPIHLGNLGLDQNLGNVIKGGNDNYYNNVDYVQGPSYFGKTQGTPLFLSPEYNTDGSLNFKGNRIQALHLGIEGYLHPYLQYRVLLTSGQNWGKYYQPFTYVHTGFASHLEFLYTFPKNSGWQARLETGYDTGDFFGGTTFGASITLTKRGLASCLCE
ncbi:MAG: capsule assembly Wzi family protein [Dysgonamonadaceae bacterium]|jgi:hypothetical protein|nr:capsule assembly Wzi family protein [Dysgonamonadaceae bacterium]